MDDCTKEEQVELAFPKDDTQEKVTDNPYVANAPESSGGVKLRIPPRETFVPKPWKSIEQVICVSYVCYLALVFPGAIANQYAWEALKFRDLGGWSEAKEMGRSAVCCVYVGFTILGVATLIGIIIVIVHFSTPKIL